MDTKAVELTIGDWQEICWALKMQALEGKHRGDWEALFNKVKQLVEAQ